MALTAGKWVCESCTTAAIQNLSSHKNALEAMVQFCKSQLATPESRYGSVKGAGKYQRLYSFYVFNAGPEDTSTGKIWVKYGTEFAAFIRKHKLGKVVTHPKKENAKWHPKKNCQAWLWSPDQAALEAWYESYLAESKKK